MESRKQIAARIRTTRRRRIIEFIRDRERSGYNQGEAAEALGIQPNFISQLVMDQGNPGFRGIGEPLARYMEQHAGLPIMWFDELVIDEHMTPHEQKLLQNYRLATTKVRSVVDTLLEPPTAEVEAADTTVIQPAQKAS